eukprot:COSAG01_NODE_3711_length_5769_cov_10.210545_10_plen_177_part_00
MPLESQHGSGHPAVPAHDHHRNDLAEPQPEPLPPSVAPVATAVVRQPEFEHSNFKSTAMVQLSARAMVQSIEQHQQNPVETTAAATASVLLGEGDHATWAEQPTSPSERRSELSLGPRGSHRGRSRRHRTPSSPPWFRWNQFSRNVLMHRSVQLYSYSALPVLHVARVYMHSYVRQ